MATKAFSPHGTHRSRLELALSRELHDGERVVWSDMPLRRVSWKAFGIYLFAIPWTAFSVFWTAMAAAGVSGTDWDGVGSWMAWAFPMFGLPFVAVGIGMLAMPFLPLWESNRVLYAVTNRRIIRIRLGRSLHVTSCPKDRIGHLTKREGRDGSGSLSIAVSVGRDSDGDAKVERFVLEEIANVFEAQTVIERLAGQP